MSVYYNEHDPKAAAWLRELIKAGAIAGGEVDERDIRDVPAHDLRAFRQLHLFAGIGGWSLALRLAGWPDDRPVLTVSCPCPSFSAAGAGGGFADERHLWPAACWIIDQLRPPVVMGEQVEAAIAHGWLDLVCDDLEGLGYASRAIVLPACSVGAPHLRQRLWFVAESQGEQHDRSRNAWRGRGELADDGELADPESRGQRIDRDAQRPAGHLDERVPVEQLGESGLAGLEGLAGHVGDWHEPGRQRAGAARSTPAAGESFWSDLIWLPCRDGKARPTQSGLQPLAHGVSARVGRLRGYGNAIVPQVAAEVIAAYLTSD